MDSKAFYTTGEIARLLDMSPATIFRAIEKGQLKSSTTPGGHNRISREDLETFLKTNNISLRVLDSRARRMRVLIVEDNPAELRMFKRALQSVTDLEIMTTPSGYEAGFLTKSFWPELILLDIFLQETDGREIVKLIRGDPELKGAKIIAISGAASPEDLQAIKACGVDDFIQKPVSPDELRERVLAFSR